MDQLRDLKFFDNLSAFGMKNVVDFKTTDGDDDDDNANNNRREFSHLSNTAIAYTGSSMIFVAPELA